MGLGDKEIRKSEFVSKTQFLYLYINYLLNEFVSGQIFDFANEPVSKQCWNRVRECKVYLTIIRNNHFLIQKINSWR